MHPAALASGAAEPPVRGGTEAAVRIGDHQAHAAEAPLAQRVQELLPEPFGLAVADVAAQNLPVAACGDARGDDGGHRGGLGEVVAHVQIGGVQIHVRELDVVQAAGSERLDHLARPPLMRDTSDLEIPDSAPSAATRSSTERVETPAT